MAEINHNMVSDYYKKRPQLKRPELNWFGFVIEPEWKPFVESMIKRIEELEEIAFNE